MDRIEKFLRRLSKKELSLVQKTIRQLLQDDVSNLNLKKLKGHDNVYRVRIQNLRIIFSIVDSDIKILEISRRREQTYKKF